MAPARARLRGGLHPRHRADRRRRRRPDPRACDRRHPDAGRPAHPRQGILPFGRIRRHQRFLRAQPLPVPAGRPGRRHHRATVAVGAAAGPAHRRSEPAGAGAGDVARPDGRGGRAGDDRRPDAAVQHVGRRNRKSAGRRAGLVLVVRADERGTGDGLADAPRRHDQAGARSSRAAAGPEGERGDTQGGGRARPRQSVRRDGAADRTGRDRRRGVRHPEGGRLPQRHRHHRGRPAHPVAGAQVVPNHRRGRDQSRGRSCDHGRARPPDGRRAQSHLGRVRGAVRRPRRRLRHPVQRALPDRTPRLRRSAQGLARRRQTGRGAADARGRRDRGGLPVVPADRLPRPVGARPHRRRRHGDRIHHQHHVAAGLAAAVQSAGRVRAARLCGARAGRPLPRGSPRAGDRRHPADRGGGPAAALLSALRFQPDQSAQPEGRIDRDLSRLAARSQPQLAHRRGDGADRRGGGRDRQAARRAAASRPHDDDRQFRADRSAAEARAHRRGRHRVAARAQSARRQAGADRRRGGGGAAQRGARIARERRDRDRGGRQGGAASRRRSRQACRCALRPARRRHARRWSSRW